MTPPPIRDAATVILLRDATTHPKVLMGQRGKNAAFMPNKYVFPGGAVDASDRGIPFAAQAPELTLSRLKLRSDDVEPQAVLAAAVREVWEETGLMFASFTETATQDLPDTWEHFFASGHAPSAAGFHYIFRAITPPGRPRRFDARFFLVEAETCLTDLDDFSRAEDELSHLHWVDLEEAKALDLPFITEVVLAEVSALAKTGLSPESVPFFNNSTEISEFLRLA
ncbi:MAG: NUDIX hydrolase [Litoreibacter sp.]|nr:NUDIX hydrolase [Litoreibacter sp.]MCY4336739.1 NUDIX hydrolase [Litoreibacter sp.]